MMLFCWRLNDSVKFYMLNGYEILVQNLNMCLSATVPQQIF